MAQNYQLPIGMSTFILCRSSYIDAESGSAHRGHTMSKLVSLALAALALSASAASAQSLTQAQARAVIAPWYSLFNVANRGDVKAIQEQVLTADYESCAGYLPGECWGRDTSIKVVANFANSIPDMKFDIKEVLVAGDRVIVRGEVRSEERRVGK